MPWLEEHDALLRKLWPVLDAKTIAARIPQATKNSVIGRAHRIGLKKKPKTLPARKATEGRTTKRCPPRDSAGTPKTHREHKKRTERQAAPVRRMKPTRTVATIERRECRFPLGAPGQPGFGFCGRGTNGGVYCAVHHAIAYVLPPKHAPQAAAGRGAAGDRQSA